VVRVSVVRVSVAGVSAGPQAVAPASTALEAAAPGAEGPEAEDSDTEGPAADPAGSPARVATRAGKPTATERRARTGHLEPLATTGPVRVSRVGPAGQADSRQAAPKKPVVGSARRGRADGRYQPVPVAKTVAASLPAGARGSARAGPGFGCGSVRLRWP
jgi:hypothetical protein